MRLDLLLDVVKVLEAVPEKDFNMTVWQLKLQGCNTIGCAIGHYCYQNPDIELKCIETEEEERADNCTILFRYLFEYFAIAKYFNITKEDAVFLFSSDSYKGEYEAQFVPNTTKYYWLNTTAKSEVISRILKFVEDHSPKETRVIQQKELAAV